jgi:hypothetical protein
MESYQWVIAVSTATIAVVLLTAVIFLIKVGLTLKKNVDSLAEDVERKIQAVNGTWRDIWNLPREGSEEPTHEQPRVFDRILRGVVFATAFWRNLQKRR